MSTTLVPTDVRGYKLGADISKARGLYEALDLSGLNWHTNLVNAENMTVTTNDGVTATSIPGMRLAMRSDNGVTLGVVGGKFAEINNVDLFGGMGKALIDQGARPTRAGELDFGRRVFMDFEFSNGNVGLANGKDLVQFSARIRANHDGKGQAVAEIRGTRLWCTNGCSVDIAGIPHVFKISHLGNAVARIAQGVEIMQGAGRYVAAFTGAAERLLSTKMSRSDFGTYIDALFPRPVEPTDGADRGYRAALTRWETQRGELLTLWAFADTNELGRGTAWGAFNSVTEYLDWGTQVRQGSADSVEQARAIRQFDNANQELRNRAWFALAA